MADCKWMQDEICVNDRCPMCADFCPVVDYPGVCRFEDRGQEGGTIETIPVRDLVDEDGQEVTR